MLEREMTVSPAIKFQFEACLITVALKMKKEVYKEYFLTFYAFRQQAVQDHQLLK